VTENICNFS